MYTYIYIHIYIYIYINIHIYGLVPGPRPSFKGELGWSTFGPNRLGRSVYGPYPHVFGCGVFVPV